METLSQTIIWLILALLVFILIIQGFYQLQEKDPYIKTVLSLTGDRVQGHVIFQMNCSGCHGVQANGKVGPSLHGISKHKSRIGLIKQVISGQTPPMPQFQPSTQEMADLLEYLESL